MEVSFRTARVCSKCDAEYLQDCLECPDCGVELVARKFWRCADCGTEVGSELATCWSCNSAMPDNVEHPAAPEDERRSSAQLQRSITASGQGTSEGESASANPDRMPAQPPDAGETSCASCGALTDGNARFCKHCGHSLGSEQPEPLVYGLLHRRIDPRVLAGGLCLVVLTALLTYMVIGDSPAKRSLVQPSTQTADASSLTLGSHARELEERILRNKSLTDSDLRDLNPDELRILRNVHFAKYGRQYDRPGLGDYFVTCPWYRPTASYNDRMLTETDKANVNAIVAAEATAKNTTPVQPPAEANSDATSRQSDSGVGSPVTRG